MRVAGGSFTGDGTAPRAITGVGFAPDVVFLTTTANNATVVKTINMLGNNCGQFVGGSGRFLGGDTWIRTLDSDGFTIGTDANPSGATIRWVAFQVDVDNSSQVGTYSGNGSANRDITGLAFQPDFVFVWTAGDSAAEGVWWTTSKGGDNSYAEDGGPTVGRIQGVGANSFRVGTDARVNTNGTNYYYLCLKNRTGQIATGSYIGNGVANTNITQADAFQPTFLFTTRDIGGLGGSGATAVYRGAGHVGDLSTRLGALNTGDAGNLQAMNSNGFQIGANISVNSNTQTYFYLSALNGGGPITAGERMQHTQLSNPSHFPRHTAVEVEAYF